MFESKIPQIVCIVVEKRMAAFMSPSSLPPPTKEDLNFEDPPAMINDDMQRVFWCISSKVREVILDNIGKHVFFCFHNGFCTYQSDYDKNMAKVSSYNLFSN